MTTFQPQQQTQPEPLTPGQLMRMCAIEAASRLYQHREFKYPVSATVRAADKFYAYIKARKTE
jgi:hypothetical protein